MRGPLAVAAITFLTVCARDGERPSEADAPTRSAVDRTYKVIHATAEPLRSDFEADSGKVRAILLVSPT